MGCSRPSAIGIVIAVALLLLVASTESRRFGGRKHHRFGMDDCGRNRTCRELSRECKKMFFTSMIEDYVEAGDDEIITTVEKMAAIMAMHIEHKKNLTDCANETGIELPNYGGKNDMKKFNEMPRHGGGSYGGPRGGPGFRGGKALLRHGREARYFGFGEKRRGFGSGKWHTGNFGVSEEDAIELNKCLLGKKELLSSNETLDREAFKDQISSAYDSEPGIQAAVLEAVDTCPEPEDYNIHAFIKCINKACIDNLELDEDEDADFPQENKKSFRPSNRWGVLP